jgi:hypothetical protein
MSAARGWGLYGAAWAVASLLWTAAATSVGMRALDALPYGLLVMGVAAGLGVGVWHLSGRLDWPPRRWTFWAAHIAALCTYAAIYATAPGAPDVPSRGLAALARPWREPVTAWNLLMGSGLYLVVAGLSYAVRADRRRQRETDAAAQARLLARDAQLAALRAQVNPHFLFNALHSVSALVRADADAADRALDQLGGLLRYALRDGDDLVTLDEEWRFTERYLDFERLRFGDALRVDAVFDPQTRDQLMPAFTLQPLVENAVRHGIAPTGSGTVTIRAAAVDGVVRLSVSNAASPALEPTRSAGTGLQALRRRLQLTYGDSDTWMTTRQTGDRFDVEVIVPAGKAS